jgi:uncharacterized damage-inducible protein DinB
MSVLEVARRLHVYNRWANSRILASMDGLTPDDMSARAPVAFDTLRGAVWHMIGAQLGWLRLCAGYDTWSLVPVRDAASAAGVAEILSSCDLLWREFLSSISEDDILGDIDLPIDDPFRGAVGPELLNWSEEHGHRPRRPMWQSVLHVVNHSTQHRAEIGMYLASLGRSPDDMDYGTFEEFRAIRSDEEITGPIR